MAARSTFLDLVAERVVVYDGATGTWLQTQGLTADDFGGDNLEGCNELLGVTRRRHRRDQHVRQLRHPAR
jgi:5-methyltetrahydrofolate--homocysteine methyltransferase